MNAPLTFHAHAHACASPNNKKHGLSARIRPFAADFALGPPESTP